MRRSVVSSRSKPASSAAFNNSPLLSASQPRDSAVWTVCPTSVRASPFGVPWSNRTSTGRDFGTQTFGDEFENGLYLFARHVELLDDLVDAEVLEILNDGGDGQAGPLKYPRASNPIGDTLDCRALGPVKRGHAPTSSSPAYGMSAEPSRCIRPRLEDGQSVAASPRFGSNWRMFRLPFFQMILRFVSSRPDR